MWKLTIEDDEGKQTALPLAHEEYSLGRGETNAIRLTDRNISRTHAIIRKNGLGWFVKDNQSYNGTFVNGIRVVGEQAIASGDLVQIGDYRLELLDEAIVPLPGAPAVPAAPPVHQRPNRLVVVVGPTPGAEFPLDKEHFTIGRSEEATISVNHSSVSRVHAELIALGNGRYEIVDKQSANGIRINGVELKRGILEAGDALELGDVRLRFVGAGKIFRADMSQALTAMTGPSSDVAPSSRVGIGKLVGIGALVGIAVIVGIVMLLRPSSGSDTDPQKPGTPMSEDAARKQLDAAQEKLKAGDVEGAHKAALQIPESSHLRDENDFKGIESAWADGMFAKVDQAAESAEKKRILKEINATSSVDAQRRKKAADMVADIEAKEPPPAPPPPVYIPGNPGGAATPSATASSTPGPAPGGVAPQGLAAEDAQRKALEPKVWSGKASVDEIRLLKAICSHLGNRECRDRASAMLKKKLEQAP